MKALTLEQILNLCGMVAYCQEVSTYKKVPVILSYQVMPSSSPFFPLRKESSGRIRLLFHLCIIIGRVTVSRLTFLTFTELWGLPDIYTPGPPPALLVLPNLGQLLQ